MNDFIFNPKISNKPNSNEKHIKIPSDVFGSYTGTPLNEEYPTQDADDL